MTEKKPPEFFQHLIKMRVTVRFLENCAKGRHRNFFFGLHAYIGSLRRRDTLEGFFVTLQNYYLHFLEK